MTDERRTEGAAPAGGAPKSGAAAPATLDPKSLGCLIPGALTLAIILFAYFGLQKLKASTGYMSLQAAEYGLTTSGLPEASKAPFAAEIQRLRDAHEAETLGAQEVVQGVSGLLETRTVQLLVLDDVRARRIPASGLDDAEKAAAEATLGRVATCVDGQTMGLPALLTVLGPLIEVPEDGSVVALDDDGLRALVARADEALVDVEAPTEPRAADSAALLERFRAHIDATLSATGSGD